MCKCPAEKQTNLAAMSVYISDRKWGFSLDPCMHAYTTLTIMPCPTPTVELLSTKASTACSAVRLHIHNKMELCSNILKGVRDFVVRVA